MVTAYKRYFSEDDSYFTDLSLKPVYTNVVTRDLIEEILENQNVVQVIKSDLLKVRQIGYKEEWRLGLITPDQDKVNLRFDRLLSLHSKRTAVVHSTDYFKRNNIAINNGAVKPLGKTKWTYGLSTKLNGGEYIDIRNVTVENESRFSEHRNRSLSGFLKEDGFPLKDSYADGDPLTTDRGGTIVINEGKVIVIYPRYFVQRRLIDDEGNLVDIGIDEDFSHKTMFDIKMQPSVSRKLFQRVSASGYIPVVRYRSFPYASKFMLPLLDTPMSASGWADLFVDTRGEAKLFVAKEKTEAEWYEMMERLRQLFCNEVAKKNNHLLRFTKDIIHLNEYLYQKQKILEDYFIIQDCALF